MRYLTPAPGAPNPTQTALIAPIPEADRLVHEHRQRLDPAAGWGVPAHITVLGPFVEPAAVDEHLMATLSAATRSVSAFRCRFTRTRWFEHDVLWLDPEPAGPFRQLTAAVWAAFPQHPPYGGAYDNIVPHLTVAEGRRSDLAAMKAAEQAVQQGLPFTARIDRLLLIAGAPAPSSWGVLRELPLADR